MNKIPAGYKKTEVGIIPEDWVVFAIENLTPQNRQYTIVDGPFGSNLKTIHYRKSGIPIITSGFVTEGKFFATEYLYVDLSKFKQEKRSAVRGGDIVMAKIGERCGASAILPINHPEGILSGNALKITIDENRFSKDLIAQILWHHHVKGNFEILRTTGAQPAISMANLKKYKIPLPQNLSEQTAIATALNDADALITQLEKLIAKKRLIKQGAMQQLLKPKPGWQSKKLGEIAEVVGGGTPSTFTPSYWNGNINWFTPTEIGDKKYSYQSIRKITQEGFANSSAKLLSPGTILLTSRASIGDVSILMTEGCTNQGFQSLVAKEAVDSEFLYYLALTLKPILQQNASGSTFLEISPKKLKAISIKIPDKSQQISISQALSGIDKEIDALEAKLAKYKQIKQGMMQTLLTGKIRLL
jgi:type I restriction enzyme S subunit